MRLAGTAKGNPWGQPGNGSPSPFCTPCLSHAPILPQYKVSTGGCQRGSDRTLVSALPGTSSNGMDGIGCAEHSKWELSCTMQHWEGAGRAAAGSGIEEARPTTSPTAVGKTPHIPNAAWALPHATCDSKSSRSMPQGLPGEWGGQQLWDVVCIEHATTSTNLLTAVHPRGAATHSEEQ